MLSFQTEAVRLRQSAVPDVDGLRSFDFQTTIEKCLMDATTRAVFLSAETGAGKTRAFALPALKHRKNLIIVAPTNALIHDIRLNVVKLCDQIGAPHIVHVVTRYALYALKGQIPPERRPTQGQALLRLLKGEDGQAEQPRILVTNPDSLSVALQALYYNSEGILREVVHRFPWIVFDEFHAYSPKQIPSILFLHALTDTFAGSAGRKTVFSSATPSGPFRETLQKLLDLPDEALVELRAETAEDGFQVLQPTSFTLIPRASDWDTPALRRYVAEKIPDIRQHLKSASVTDIRRVCVIANSVFEASEITDLLERAGFKRGKDVEEIRGFLAPGERGRGQLPIVVGTSAIEMGVNFPISLLFTEGSEGAALIQRLGRLGRGSSPETAKAHALVPQTVYDQLANLNGKIMPRGEFRNKVLDVYPTFKNFWEYVEQLGLYENRFYIRRMEEMNARYRSEKVREKGSPRQAAYLQEHLFPKLARAYKIADWQVHLRQLDDVIEKKGRRAREALEQVLSSPRGETVPISCAIFDRADERRNLFPFKVYDARLLLSRGDIRQNEEWKPYIQDGAQRRRPPQWYRRAAQVYCKSHPAFWEEHWQEVESSNVRMFVELNGLKEDAQKVEYETQVKFSGLKQGALYALDLRYWFEALGLMENADFSGVLQGRSTLVASLQYGRYQGALKQTHNLPPLFEINALHLGGATFQVAFGINALYIWSQTLAELAEGRNNE
jgi:CRISPR-associated helicase Cas3